MHLMLHFARAYPRQTAVMLLALLLAGLVEGVGLTALLPMLNLALSGADAGGGAGQFLMDGLRGVGITPTVGTLLAVLVLGVVVKSLLVLLADRKVGYTVAHVATDLRLALLQSLLVTRWEYFLHQPIGSLANSAATEVMRASRAYLHGAMALTLLVQALVYGGVALMINWQATLVASGAALVLVLSLNRLVRKTRKAGRRQTQLLQSLASRLTDSLQSVKPLKAMGREGLADTLLRADTHQLNRALRKQVTSKAALKSFQEPMIMLLIAIGLYVALVLWHLELPTVMVLVFLIARLLTQVGKVQRQHQDMMTCESAYWSLQDKIREALGQREPVAGSRRVALEREIRFEAVSFAYEERWILREIHLTIPAGSYVSVVGPSGAGKTTIADLVTGLLRPQEGEVLIDGVPLGEVDLQDWRRRIGYVPQDTVLLHDSVLINVTLGDESFGEEEAIRALEAAGAWGFVKAMPQGLHSLVGERGSKLSGGQRQRIAIARALVHRPRLLILDEATSALDPETEQAICRTLEGLRGQLAILAISHQPALVRPADRIYRLEGGLLLEQEDRPQDQAAGVGGLESS